MELFELTLKEATQKIKKREISSLELTKAFLKRIDQVDEKISAFLDVEKEAALKTAKEIDHKIQKGEYRSPLMGIPVAVKDNILTKGIKTTAGSKILKDYQAIYDATVTKKLKKAGVVLLGKTNLDEFGMGASTENSAFQKTNNPYDLSRVPGGSSGGSAAAVAADECIFALGSDTGGSVRQPAAFCGVVGLKPTYGRVSRYGLIALASSFDQIGPITKTVEDAALVLNQIAGKDAFDSTSASEVVPDYTKELAKEIKGIKIGIPKEYFIKGIDKEVEKLVRAAIDKLKELGAQIQEVSLPYTNYALAAYYIILPAEASANLARYDGIRYGYSALGKEEAVKNLFSVYSRSRANGFGDEVKRRIMIGTYSLSSGYYDAYYLRAQKVKTLVAKDFKEVFQKVDLLATPTTPTVAFRLGEKLDNPLTMYLSDIYTVSANMGGIPAISIPCGMANQLPVGIQLIGKPFAESQILNVAYQYEQATDWHFTPSLSPPL